ncbi:MAG: TlpA family protein disulfide reductase [Leptospiraceae bacterium]|nr:TlpA family protein disulfide reductase [Leptospiraceae bacterium]MDW8305586.1 TlpA disulfide reductase family protein [Leptospiraceae bacterium]
MRKLFLWLLVLFGVHCRGESFIDEEAYFPALGQEGGFRLKEASYQELVVNFFAPHCPPCIEELPELRAFFKNATPHRGFLAIGSTLEALQDPERGTLAHISGEVENFVKEHNLNYPVYLADHENLKSWNIRGFPETFVFMRERNNYILKRKFISAVKLNQLEDYLSP